MKGTDMTPSPGTYWHYPPTLPDADEHTYSSAAGMRLWVMRSSAAEPSPAVVFFFGGAWVTGTPGQFAAQARYLASRGVSSLLVDYRVASRHGSSVRDSVDDAVAAFTWIRSHATELNIDPDRIAAGGGSAGGHLAALLATLENGVAPAALLLFNPVLILASPDSELADLNPPTVVASLTNWGLRPESYSPLHLLEGADLPPTLIQHGRADQTVPFAASQEFVRRFARADSPCELIGYDGLDHGFFNPGEAGNWPYLASTRRVDEFLATLAWVDGPPTLEGSASYSQ